MTNLKKTITSFAVILILTGASLASPTLIADNSASGEKGDTAT